MVTARSGLEAIERAQAEPFVVLVTAVQMPGLDGLETVARLRRSPRTGEVPIIFVSATHDDPRTIKRAYALGAVDYVKKPVEPEILCANGTGQVTVRAAGEPTIDVQSTAEGGRPSGRAGRAAPPRQAMPALRIRLGPDLDHPLPGSCGGLLVRRTLDS